jgi:hypothetical protein
MEDPGTVTLTSVTAQLADLGVRHLYLKPLAENDNSKNQIYLGGGDWAVLNALPAKTWLDPVPMTRGFIVKAELDFSWVDGRGHVLPMSGARLILYPQYPEIRLSGFLRGAGGAPSFIGQRLPGRVLVLGVTADGRIYAFASRAEDAVSQELLAQPRTRAAGALWEIPLHDPGDQRRRLLDEFHRVHLLGWLDPVRLTAQGILPCHGPNCGGLTLEAALGVSMNSLAEPDLLGYEVKQHQVTAFDRVESGVLTLMTPEPTAGLYRTAGVEAFVRRFGAPDALGREDRLNFGGVHRYGIRSPRTGLTLRVPGWDVAEGRLVDPTGGLALLADDDEPAAVWPFPRLIEHWQRKHLHAAYVPAMRRSVPRVQYSFGGSVRLGERTDFGLFMNALIDGLVYYDPGIKLEHATGAQPAVKRRNQFRIRSGDLPHLYETMETVDTEVSSA